MAEAVMRTGLLVWVQGREATPLSTMRRGSSSLPYVTPGRHETPVRGVPPRTGGTPQ